MESAWWSGSSRAALTVAGQSGASGRPAPGPVVVESRTHTETVTTRCKSQIPTPALILLAKDFRHSYRPRKLKFKTMTGHVISFVEGKDDLESAGRSWDENQSEHRGQEVS